MARNDYEFTVRPIGFVRSPFREARGTPIYPRVAPSDVAGTVELLPEFVEGLLDLDGFERIWLVCWMSRAAPANLVVTPYADDRPHGVFACRAPARPNPIAISTVRLARIDGGTLHIREFDLLDGTPVLDIKPYVPSHDAYPGAAAGWVDAKRVPHGVADDRFEIKKP